MYLDATVFALKLRRRRAFFPLNLFFFFFLQRVDCVLDVRGGSCIDDDVNCKSLPRGGDCLPCVMRLEDDGKISEFFSSVHIYYKACKFSSEKKKSEKKNRARADYNESTPLKARPLCFIHIFRESILLPRTAMLRKVP